MRRAREKEGVLRNPTANAIPDGRYLTLFWREGGRFWRKALREEMKAKKRPKDIMKGMTWSGR
jgi:hypothetical protein